MALDVDSNVDDQEAPTEPDANDIFKHTMVNVDEPASARFNEPTTKREEHEIESEQMALAIPENRPF